MSEIFKLSRFFHPPLEEGQKLFTNPVFDTLERAASFGLDLNLVLVDGFLDKGGMIHASRCRVETTPRASALRPYSSFKRESFCEDCHRDLRTLSAANLADVYGPRALNSDLAPLTKIRELTAKPYKNLDDFRLLSIAIRDLDNARSFSRNSQALDDFRVGHNARVKGFLAKWHNFDAADELLQQLEERALDCAFPPFQGFDVFDKHAKIVDKARKKAMAAIRAEGRWGVLYSRFGMQYETFALWVLFGSEDPDAKIMQAPLHLLTAAQAVVCPVESKLTPDVMEIITALEEEHFLDKAVQLAVKI